LLYWGYLLARALARTLPLTMSYWIAERAGDIWYALSPRTRRNLDHNLSLVPNVPPPGGARARLKRRIVRNFARVVAEFLYFPRLDRSNLGKLVDIESFTHLKQTMQGRPAILVTSHLGNWELAAATLALLGVDLSVVVYDHPDARVARLFRERREAKGLKVMSVRGAMWEITGALRKTSVGIVGDRDYSGQGKEAVLLGKRVTVPFAYGGLATAMRRPVIVGFCVRGPGGRYTLALEEKVYDPDRDKRTPEEIVGACLAIFEKGVEKYTEQWYFFERVDSQWRSSRGKPQRGGDAREKDTKEP
jgi:lauroyl/myristoyl acyltransferase